MFLWLLKVFGIFCGVLFFPPRLESLAAPNAPTLALGVRTELGSVEHLFELRLAVLLFDASMPGACRVA